MNRNILLYLRYSSILICLILIAINSGKAQTAEHVIWGFGTRSADTLDLPESIVNHSKFWELEYMGSPDYMGLQKKLNNDSIPEYIIQSAQSLCGNGECPYLIFDGETHSHAGTLFGSLFYITNIIINGWPVLYSYANLSHDSGSFTVSVYSLDKRRYIQVHSIKLRDSTLDEFMKSFEDMNIWRIE